MEARPGPVTEPSVPVSDPPFGVWARCCQPCQTVAVCRSYGDIVNHAKRHPGHLCYLAGGKDVVTVGDLAQRLQEPFRGLYLEGKLDDFFEQEASVSDEGERDE